MNRCAAGGIARFIVTSLARIPLCCGDPSPGPIDGQNKAVWIGTKRQIRSTTAPKAADAALLWQARLPQAFYVSFENRLVAIGWPVPPPADRKLRVEPHYLLGLSARLVHHAEFGEAGG